MLRILLVRHGEATGNAARQFIGSRDDELTLSGLSQAEQLRDAVCGLPVTALYSSTLSRAVKTAEIMARTLMVPIITDTRLTEQDFGAWEGCTVAPISMAENAGKSADWTWTSLDVDMAPPGGEALTHVQERVVKVIPEIEATFETGLVIIVSHVGPIKALLCSAMDAPLRVSKQLFLDTGRISVIEWRSPPIVRTINGPPDPSWLRSIGSTSP